MLRETHSWLPINLCIPSEKTRKYQNMNIPHFNEYLVPAAFDFTKYGEELPKLSVLLISYCLPLGRNRQEDLKNSQLSFQVFENLARKCCICWKWNTSNIIYRGWLWGKIVPPIAGTGLFWEILAVLMFSYRIYIYIIHVKITPFYLGGTIFSAWIPLKRDFFFI